MTLDLEVNEVEVKVLTSLASVTEDTADKSCHQVNSSTLPHSGLLAAMLEISASRSIPL
jgi:hypothetical protein